MKVKVNESVEKDIVFPYYYKFIPPFQLNNTQREQYSRITESNVVSISVDILHKVDGTINTEYRITEKTASKYESSLSEDENFTEWVAKNIRLDKKYQSSESEFLFILSQAMAFVALQYHEINENH